MTNEVRRIITALLLSVVGYYVGAMFNFFPFLVGDITFRAVGFCTMLVCLFLAFCTNEILGAMKKDGEDEDERGSRE